MPHKNSNETVMWLTLAFFSSLFLGLDEVAKKSALKDNAVIPVLALSILLSAALFLPLQLVSVFSPDTLLDTAFYIPPVSADAHWGILLKAAIVLGSWIFGFFATKHLPLTISSSVKASRPVFVVLGAILIFGERLNFSQWAGVIVVLTALVVLSNLDKRDGRDDREPPRRKMLWVYFLIASTLLGAAECAVGQIPDRPLRPAGHIQASHLLLPVADDDRDRAADVVSETKTNHAVAVAVDDLSDRIPADRIGFFVLLCVERSRGAVVGTLADPPVGRRIHVRRRSDPVPRTADQGESGDSRRRTGWHHAALFRINLSRKYEKADRRSAFSLSCFRPFISA